MFVLKFINVGPFPFAFPKGFGWQRTLIVKVLVWLALSSRKAFCGHCATSRRFADSPSSASAPFLQSPTTSVWEHFTNHGNHWHRISAEHCQHGPELGAHFTSYFPHSLTLHMNEEWCGVSNLLFKINGGIWNWFLQKKTLGLCQHFGQKLLMKKVWSLSKSSAQHSSSSAAFTNPPSSLPTSLCWQ